MGVTKSLLQSQIHLPNTMEGTRQTKISKLLVQKKVHGSLPNITSILRTINGMQTIASMQYMNW